MTDWHPDQDWLDREFQAEVVPDLLQGVRADRPVVVLLGAQPGAGKTRGAVFAQQQHPGVQLVAITGDDYRSLHPDFKRLQRDCPLEMPNITQVVSGPMVARAIEYVHRHRISAIVEGTFRDPMMVVATAERFHAAGFEVHVVALAVPPAVSRASTLARYYDTLGTAQNRWTPPGAHEAALRGMPASVAALGASSSVDRFTIVDRQGVVLEESSVAGRERGLQMSRCLELHWTRELTVAEQRDLDSIQARIATIQFSQAEQLADRPTPPAPHCDVIGLPSPGRPSPGIRR